MWRTLQLLCLAAVDGKVEDELAAEVAEAGDPVKIERRGWTATAVVSM